MTGEESNPGDPPERDPDDAPRGRVDAVLVGMHASAEETKHRELEAALSKLDHRGELTPERRAGVVALADALVARLLASPTAGLSKAAERGDRETVDAIADLFDWTAADGEHGSRTPDDERCETGSDCRLQSRMGRP